MERYHTYLRQHGRDDSARRHNSTARVCERNGWVIEGDIHEHDRMCHLKPIGQTKIRSLVTYFGHHGEGFDTIVIVQDNGDHDLRLHLTFQHGTLLRCSLDKVVPSKEELVGSRVSPVREESGVVDDEIKKFIIKNFPNFS